VPSLSKAFNFSSFLASLHQHIITPTHLIVRLKRDARSHDCIGAYAVIADISFRALFLLSIVHELYAQLGVSFFSSPSLGSPSFSSASIKKVIKWKKYYEGVRVDNCTSIEIIIIIASIILISITTLFTLRLC
jgi:hypothetical protein